MITKIRHHKRLNPISSGKIVTQRRREAGFSHTGKPQPEEPYLRAIKRQETRMTTREPKSPKSVSFFVSHTCSLLLHFDIPFFLWDETWTSFTDEVNGWAEEGGLSCNESCERNEIIGRNNLMPPPPESMHVFSAPM